MLERCRTTGILIIAHGSVKWYNTLVNCLQCPIKWNIPTLWSRNHTPRHLPKISKRIPSLKIYIYIWPKVPCDLIPTSLNIETTTALQQVNRETGLVYLYNEILNIKKEQNVNICNNMETPNKHVEWKKIEMKDSIVYEPMSIKF